MARQRSWSDDDLRRAVAEATSYGELGEKLGLHRSGGSQIRVRVRIAELGLDTSHLDRARRRRRADDARARRQGRSSPKKRGRRRTWTEDDLRAAVPRSRSYAEVLRRLGLKPGGATYVLLKQAITDLGIDTSHMAGRHWAKGMTRPFGARGRPLEEILVEDSDYATTNHLRKRLIAEGVKARRCDRCDRTDWNAEPIPLELDHINGNRLDNRVENLRLLCPNCHAQTDTYCGKNIGAYDVDRADETRATYHVSALAPVA